MIRLTLAELLTQIATQITAFVPDFEIYLSGAVVVSLTAFGISKLLKSGR